MFRPLSLFFNGSVAAHRMKTTIKRVDCLDYFRGMAIIAVFLFHCLATVFGAKFPWNGWFRDFSLAPSFLALLPIPACIGNAGVPIFFVVSGFCIHLSFQRDHQWGGFLIRRFFRIYPPYVLAVLLFALVLPETVRRLFGAENAGLLQLVSHLLLLQNFSSSTIYGINPSFWSIAVEVQLYLIYPLLLMLVGKLGWRRSLFLLLAFQVLLAGVAGVTSTMMLAPSLRPLALEIGHYSYWLQMSPLAYWFSWSLGAWIADVYLAGQPPPLVNGSLISWFGLSFLSYFVRPIEPFGFLLFSVTAAVAINKLLSRDISPVHFALVGFRHLRLTGIWSYSIYLLHQPLLVIMNFYVIALWPGMAQHPFLRFWLCILSWLVVMPVGGIWHHCFERPSIAAGKRVVQKKSPSSAPSVGV